MLVSNNEYISLSSSPVYPSNPSKPSCILPVSYSLQRIPQTFSFTSFLSIPIPIPIPIYLHPQTTTYTMHLRSILPIAVTLLTTASTTTASPALSSKGALPQSAHRVPLRADPTNPSLTWHVSAFDIGCSPGGCVYSFNIAGVASQNTPGFNTTCNGTSTEHNYVECKDTGVLSQVVPQGYPNWTVQAQHHWREGAYADYYAVGALNITQGTGEKFDIPVAEVYGVA
ncbi:hypothetical protein BDW59DRAFT_138971 [Aspergillus cavernicola]|uniref:Uncharacterized protein n=1 Tax=Aspergillus cavernicola TaxID=176166 RepID=A0ABR4IYU2_9EURO